MAVKKTSVVIIGAGGIARHHMGCMLRMEDSVRVAGFVEPDENSRGAMAKLFTDKGGKAPPFYNTLDAFLAGNKGPADCALVASPHNMHVSQVIASMKAGMDVLVEKPMVLNAAEARKAMKVRDETGRLLSVAFQGSYSPAIHKAKELIAADEIGKVMSISISMCQNWATITKGMWRQIPEVSGGGFLMDSGSHAVNTMIDLAGADVKVLHAIQDNRGTPVEITSVVAGVFKNSVYFTIFAEGGSDNGGNNVMVVGTKGKLHTDIYGGSLRFQKAGTWEEKPVEYPASKGTFERFLNVRSGKLENPCPAEVGLRFAKFMDMVKKSAAEK